jgi:uncharacterized protein
MRNLIITGGISHPFTLASTKLAEMLAPHGLESEITEDVEAGLAQLGRGGFDLLTVYALRWSMTQHEKYAPHRARWSFALSGEGRRAIERHLARGGGMLGLHTASICFDDWDGWMDLLGGAWVWGKSSHPPFGPVEIRLDARDHPLLQGLEDFSLRDEIYGDLALVPGLVPLAHGRAAGGDWKPILWERRVGAGRVVYDALGHDVASLSHPMHAQIVTRAALLAAGAANPRA